MKLADKIHKVVNNEFSTEIDKALNEKYKGIKAETTYGILSTCLITSWKKIQDKKKAVAVKQYAEAFSKGYGAAMSHIGK